MYPKLKPEAKTLFIELLGQLEQTTAISRRTIGEDQYTYCASGVLAETIRRITGEGEFISGGGYFVLRSTVEVGFPISIRSLNKVLEKQWRKGYGGYGDSQYLPFHLLEMNDMEKKTFTEIAEWVKENL